MDELDAFKRLWSAEGNAGRAATLLGYAFVLQVAGWDALGLSASRKRDAQNAFDRSGVDPGVIGFRPQGLAAEPLTPERVAVLRREVEGQFAMLAYNIRGHKYKKTEWRDRHQASAEDDDL